MVPFAGDIHVSRPGDSHDTSRTSHWGGYISLRTATTYKGVLTEVIGFYDGCPSFGSASCLSMVLKTLFHNSFDAVDSGVTK